ncbi:MAG: ferritin family protein [Thermoanaerobaculaceae bacterium]|jgi:rubrerythrin|nr:ferritin family protein [Thermoanaerobaculaceae bacterium]
MTQREAILDILRQAYQIEVDGYTFYSMTAERADKPAVQELFAKLASDELQHQAFLKEIGRDFEAKGAVAFAIHRRTPDAKALSQQVFSERFREQAQGATFELAVLSVGMTLETRAITYFAEAAKGASEKEVREFYEFLADWERQHLDALQKLHGMVRGDFWADGRFSPF